MIRTLFEKVVATTDFNEATGVYYAAMNDSYPEVIDFLVKSGTKVTGNLYSSVFHVDYPSELSSVIVEKVM